MDDPRVARLKEFFESLTPATLERLDQYYAPDARFKDPFNEVTGVPAIRAIFAGMYRQVDRPRFVVTRSFGQGDDAFLAWTSFSAQRRRKPGANHPGSTHIQFSVDGRVVLHRDYWDAAKSCTKSCR